MEKKEKIELAKRIEKLIYLKETKPYLFYTPGKDQKPYFESEGRVVLAAGGNRSGKTLWGIMTVLYECLGIHPMQKKGLRPMPPLYWRIVTTGFTNGIEKVIRPTIDSLLHSSDYKYDEKRATYTLLKTGSKIGLMSYDQHKSKFGGASRDGTMFDEEPPHDIYEECMMRVLDRKGRIIFAMTPENGITWVHDEIYLNQSKDIECFHLSPYNNPILDKAEIDRWAEKMDDVTKQIKIYGKFIHRTGLIYSDFNRKDHVIDPFNVPKEWTRYVAIDPAPHNPTGVIWLAVDPDENFYVYDELLVKEKTVKEVADMIKNKTGEQKIRRILIDWNARSKEQTSGYSVKSLFAQHGLYTVLGKKDVSAGILKVKEALKINNLTKKPTLRIFRSCPETIKEFFTYVWDDYKNKDLRDWKDVPKKKEDHLLDCIRYLILSKPRYHDLVQEAQKQAIYRDSVTGYWG